MPAMTPPCGNCCFFAADKSGKNGLCHGMPPQVTTWQSANNDTVFEQTRPWVGEFDAGCSLWREILR